MGDGVGSDVSGVDRLGSGACSWAMRAFPLVLFSFQRTLGTQNPLSKIANIEYLL